MNRNLSFLLLILVLYSGASSFAQTNSSSGQTNRENILGKKWYAIKAIALASNRLSFIPQSYTSDRYLFSWSFPIHDKIRTDKFYPSYGQPSSAEIRDDVMTLHYDSGIQKCIIQFKIIHCTEDFLFIETTKNNLGGGIREQYFLISDYNHKKF